MSMHSAPIDTRSHDTSHAIRRRSAPIFDFVCMRDRGRAFDGVHDAGSVLSEIMTPYCRLDAVVLCASPECVMVGERLAMGLDASFDASWSPSSDSDSGAGRGGAATVAILVIGSLVSAEDAERAIDAARAGGARSIVLAVVTGVRSALREVARDVDAVYCANMLTLAA
jgi:hypothetical protein